MLQPEDTFKLTKQTWTDKDFDQMSWHDVVIHGISWTMLEYNRRDYLVDLDYMFGWVKPEPPDSHFTFWIAPCTLVFHNVKGFQCTLEDSDVAEPPTIMSLTRKQLVPPGTRRGWPDGQYEWTFELLAGEITLRASGYTQYTRAEPIRQMGQNLTHAQRGGVRFDCPTEWPAEGSG